MNRAPATIKNFRASICKKLNARNMAQAVAINAKVTSRSEPEPIGDRQVAAIQARASGIDRKHGSRPRTTHNRILIEASLRFGAEFESVLDLSRVQASWALDRLAEIEHEQPEVPA